MEPFVAGGGLGRPQEKFQVQRPLGLSDPRRIGKVRRVRREQQHERLVLLGGTPQEVERVVTEDMGEIAFLLVPGAVDVHPGIEVAGGPAGTGSPDIELRPRRAIP